MTDLPRNPKLEGSGLIDCKPQKGPCPMNCTCCYYNRPGAFYCDINQEIMPTLEEVGDKLVRVNSGADSNIQRDLVLTSTAQYPKRFYNTSIEAFNFPAPFVFTANRQEERPAKLPPVKIPPGLMFVRLRTSPSNLVFIEKAVDAWTERQVVVNLTFMAYYDQEPPQLVEGYEELANKSLFEWKVRHINPYWCPTAEFRKVVWERMQARPYGEDLVIMCGTLESGYCRDCGNCEKYWAPAAKRMQAAAKKERKRAQTHKRGSGEAAGVTDEG